MPQEEPTQKDFNIAIVQRLHAILECTQANNQLLRSMLDGVATLVEANNAERSQKAAPAEQWKQNNPEAAELCGRAAERLNEYQTKYLEQLAGKILEVGEYSDYDDYQMNEILAFDGQRIQQLGLIMSVLSNLGVQQ